MYIYSEALAVQDALHHRLLLLQRYPRLPSVLHCHV